MMNRKKRLSFVQLLVIVSLIGIVLIVIIPDLINIYNNYEKSNFIAKTQTLYKNIYNYISNENDMNEIFSNDKTCYESKEVFNADINYYVIVKEGKIITFYASTDKLLLELIDSTIELEEINIEKVIMNVNSEDICFLRK